jgi:hypothetical protein
MVGVQLSFSIGQFIWIFWLKDSNALDDLFQSAYMPLWSGANNMLLPCLGEVGYSTHVL